MQRMWRQMSAAAAAVLAVAGLAAAQSPPPNPFPPARAVPVPAQAAAAPVVPAAGAVHVRGSGGCANCANTPAIPYAQYGPGQANGCGNCKSDLGFMFGSCKSFFNPCGPLPCEGTSRFKHRNPCPTHPYGSPYGGGPACEYNSFLNY